MTTRAARKRPADDAARPYPCKKCPFRADVEPYLRPARAAEIAHSLRLGRDFHCHETTTATEDGMEMLVTDESKLCAGALALVLRSGEPLPQQARIAERLGLLDVAPLEDARIPVYADLGAFVQAYRVAAGEDVTADLEHCGVAGDDCEDPPGWSVGGSVMTNDDPGMCSVECQSCGHPMCPACTARGEDDPRGPLCAVCAEDEEEEG